MNRSGRFLTRLLVAVASATLAVAVAPPAFAYVPISGSGSTWAQTAVDQWRRDVVNQGIQVNYSGVGSTNGRRQFLNGTTDFAVSDIPFQFHPEDNSEPENPAAGSYAYMPVTAGGTVFMYNLTINGQRVTNLRLSGQNISKIFTGVITMWNDPAIAADNPGLTMPARTIVPVVRSDGSGSSAQFTLWMINQFPQLWTNYCAKVGRQNACGFTSFYPTVSGMVAQSGDLGVSGYIAQSYGEGAIGYVNYSYALNENFPVAKMLNQAGYYTEPTADNVAVSLSAAKINMNQNDPTVYLTQDLTGVYNDTDPRTYELSSYSYFILPTTVQGQFTKDKGTTLGAFAYYFMCQGQQKAGQLGYSPLPINLVTAGFTQIQKIPGVNAQSITVAQCNNPTFSADGHNKLIDSAPMPDPRDKLGYSGGQNPGGSGGAQNNTPVKPPAQQTIAGNPSPNNSNSGGTGNGAGAGSGTGAGQNGTGGGSQPGAGQQTTAPAQQGGQQVTTAAQQGQTAPQQIAPGAGTNTGAGGQQTATGGGQGNTGSGQTGVQSAPTGGNTGGSATTTGARSGVASRAGATGAVTKPGAGTGRSAGAVPVRSAAPTATVCDPDSGACTPAGGIVAPAAAEANGNVQAAADPQLQASSVLTTAPTGWGAAQTLMIVAGFCALLLFVVPPLVARRLDRGNSPTNYPNSGR